MESKKLLLIGVIITVVVASVVGYAYYYNNYLPVQNSVTYYNQQLQYMGYYAQGNYGMMGRGMYHMMGYYGGYEMMYENTIPISEAISMMRNVPSYVKVFSNNNTLLFTSSNIILVVLGMGHERAINLTGQQPPAYAQHDVFVIYGLINPTLIIPRGATVQVVFINLDDDMLHNIAITPVPPPYPYYPMMYIRMNTIGMTPMLPYANYNSGQAYEFSFTTTFSQPGVYYYVCEYPGHAEMGMYGEIVVV
ncbi:MAG: plastocyanin/azurin family copper-binding protein [Saccharolobus sp.]|uniref:plastocyanin/azurin family copper-binding protein n=1 Tax=Saccharolobus TaxID=2100760 RepID=UPI001F103CF8|nr:plastocyanin/azurin family copper-binding protein [Saccharolobus shibatae]MCH4814696.1 plastocyanin/azurin family copper-binding protein [Saccharolobus shibatae]